MSDEQINSGEVLEASPEPELRDLVVCESPKFRARISNADWLEISLALEQYHAVFYKVWQMGRPVFNPDIETAAVQFDETGDFIYFHFNPEFWNRMDFENRLFVICHEALHIVLNHGVRTCSLNGRVNNRATNVALDLVVNHLLLRNFGFERSKIEGWEDYCWVDTVFKDKKPLPPDDEMYEFYYNLFDKVYANGGWGTGEGPNQDGTVDDHSFMGEAGEEWGKIIDELSGGLSEEEKESLKGMVDKHFQTPPKKDAKNTPAGTGTGGQWVFAKISKVKPKKKWETVIKNWSKKYLRQTDKDVEQWARLNRRLTMLPRNMFLPSDMEVEDDKEKTRIDVWFFLDTSGSCWGLKDRFFEAALSLPAERFNVRLFCFDTTVQETTLESRKIYGGGGTSFSIMEKHIQNEISKTGVKYPEAVFVITDGYGDNIKPAVPSKWYWFITQGGTKNCIDKGCNFFNLQDFE